VTYSDFEMLVRIYGNCCRERQWALVEGDSQEQEEAGVSEHDARANLLSAYNKIVAFAIEPNGQSPYLDSKPIRPEPKELPDTPDPDESPQ
jgi:hypothetical protein